MKQSALSRPLPNATLPRNSFPRGFIENFNMSSGMIVPLFSEFVPLGTKFKIDRSIFMRTNSVNTAAFPVIDFNIDFYVVPLNLLMTRYDEFKTNIQDLNSSAFGISVGDSHVPSRMPYFKVSDVKSALPNNGDLLGVPLLHGAKRLFDYLGYDDAHLSLPLPQGYDIEMNAFRLLAYQKIYYDHYRNTAYEANDPMAYNADYWYTNGNGGYIDTPGALCKMCELHYVNYRKDYFQSVYPGLNYVAADVETEQDPWLLPSNLMGALSSQSVSISGTTLNDLDRWRSKPNGDVTAVLAGVKTSSDRNSLIQDNNSEKIYHTHEFNTSATVSQSPTSLTNVQAIRAAFALDKLMRASAYAPKHVKDQLEARYGVKLRHSYGHESTWIGSFNNQITIGEVTSTANTVSGQSGDALGAIGGKGVSGDGFGHEISYSVESDSLIVGVAYALHRSMYDSNRVDAFNLKHVREDLPIPEYMDLGLRPLLHIELANDFNLVTNNKVVGFVTRDQEYKVGIDENHGLFRDNEALSVFSPHTNSYNRLASGNVDIIATPAYFKVAPSDLNSIFTLNYDPANQITDQFFGQIQWKFDARQNMSVHGQPRL